MDYLDFWCDQLSHNPALLAVEDRKELARKVMGFVRDHHAVDAAAYSRICSQLLGQFGSVAGDK